MPRFFLLAARWSTRWKLKASLTAGAAALAACSLVTSLDGLRGPTSTTGFTLSAPPTIIVRDGATSQVTVGIARTGGFSDVVSVTVSGLPPGVTASALTLTSGASSGALTFSAANAVSQGKWHVSIDGVASGGSVSASAAIDLLVGGPPGSIDLTYGASGLVDGIPDVNPAQYLCGAAFDAAGNLLIGLGPVVGSSGVTEIVRLTTDGILDPAFGTGGIANVVGIPAGFTRLFVLSSGEIELAVVNTGTSPTVTLVRLTASGTVDTSYGGGDGGVGRTVALTEGALQDVALDPEDRLLETGRSFDGGAIVIARRTPTGDLDPTFVQSEINLLPEAGPLGGSAVVAVPDGGVAVGYGAYAGYGLVRVGDQGEPDTAFGEAGFEGPNGDSHENVFRIVVQPDGKLLVGGVNNEAGGFIARHLATTGGTNRPNLNRDSSFGGSADGGFLHQGLVDIPYGSVFGLARQDNGAVLAVGASSSTPPNDAGAPVNVLWLGRLTSGGAPDSTFGDAGFVTQNINPDPKGSTYGWFVGTQPDGRIVVVAFTHSASGTSYYHPVVARFWP